VDDQVARVGHPGEGIGKDEHPMLVQTNGVKEHHQGAGQAQPPEQRRHGDLFPFFRDVPLRQKARGKNGVPQPADAGPNENVNRQPANFPVRPKPVCKGVHIVMRE